MATETKSINCVPGVYTLLAQSKPSVYFKSLAAGSGRFIIAAAQPDTNATDFVNTMPNEPVALSNLGATDNVYFQPTSNQNHLVQVIRG